MTTFKRVKGTYTANVEITNAVKTTNASGKRSIRVTAEAADGSIANYTVADHANFVAPVAGQCGVLTVEYVLVGDTTTDKDGKPVTFTKEGYRLVDFTVSKAARRAVRSADSIADVLSGAEAVQTVVDTKFGGDTAKLEKAVALNALLNSYQPKSASYVETVEQEDEEEVSTGVDAL